MKRILCFLLGHKAIVKITVTEISISYRSCSRCNCQLDIGDMNISKIPPPGSTPEEAKAWEIKWNKHYEFLTTVLGTVKQINNN